MPFDDESSLVGTRASDKTGADNGGLAGSGDAQNPGGLASADPIAMESATDPAGAADNTSVGSIPTSS
ncbi:MAG: hypothetical protein JRI97_03935 [Deltaproteobacteria bacterium]|nr:hypothetical protein [Deltaproteobacteria bacterium]